MTRRFVALALASGLLIGVAAPVSADGAWTDRIEDVDTVLAVRFEEDFPLASLMRATCAWTHFVQRPDGSGVESLRCQLSDAPVMIPAFQGEPPQTAFVHESGPCLWTSDYWWYRDESIVMAASVHYVVTPSGNVSVSAYYPAEPLVCE